MVGGEGGRQGEVTDADAIFLAVESSKWGLMRP